MFSSLKSGVKHPLIDVQKALNAFHFDPTYWRLLTRNTFRLPNQPLLQADGARWQWLYKRLRTQTKAFTWGSNDNYCLGQRVLTEDEISSDPPDVRLRRVIASRKVSWPMEMQGIQRVGIVADLQCGGWSTTLLNSIG